MDSDWLPFCPEPVLPSFELPAGAIDSHCHVFGPGERFPYAPERKYTPCDAPKERLFALRDYLGVSRNVIVQASCHGADNRALVDALIHSNGLAKGVATVKASVTDDELQALDLAGVKGVRFNFVKRLVDTLPFADLEAIAERIKPLGWHIVVYFEAPDLVEYYDFFTSLPGTIVVDHMGRPDVAKPVFNGDFDLFIKLLQDNPLFWSKVSCPERLSKSGPHAYKDVIPFANRVVETFPERVLWGTDWPHPNMKSHMPDDGQLVNFIPHIAPTKELQQKLLVDNPIKLYWPEEL